MSTRVLKFRVWDKRKTKGSATKGMLYGAQDHSLWNDFINYPESYILQQFVGILDINKKEIYGGDIVRYTSLFGNIDQGEVQFKIDGYAQYVALIPFEASFFFHPLSSGGEYEVIGNIFENPELLNVISTEIEN